MIYSSEFVCQLDTNCRDRNQIGELATPKKPESTRKSEAYKRSQRLSVAILHTRPGPAASCQAMFITQKPEFHPSAAGGVVVGISWPASNPPAKRCRQFQEVMVSGLAAFSTLGPVGARFSSVQYISNRWIIFAICSDSTGLTR